VTSVSPTLLPTDGQPRDLAGNNPLPLEDDTAAWLILDGEVDVFAVPPPRYGVARARCHLFRTGVGSLLLGVSPKNLPCATLLAVGRIGTRIAHVDCGRLLDLARRPEIAAPVAAALTTWVLGLTSGITRGPGTGEVVILEQGREVRLRVGEVAASARDIAWVSHTYGSSRFLGMDESLLHTGTRPFPLAGPGWLVGVETDTRLTAISTEVVLAEGAWLAALERFHEAVLRRADANIAAEEAVERDRLKKQVSAEQRLTRSTFLRLAQAVVPELPEALGGRLEADPVLAACRLIGATLGIDFQPPPSAGVRQRGGDPVRAIARASRVRTRRVVLAGNWWRQDNGPLLAFRGQGDRSVALLPLSASRYEAVDPLSGQRTQVNADVAAEMMPFAYSFYRSLAARPIRFWDLLRFGLAGSRRDWVRVVALGLTFSLLGLLPPLITAGVFDVIIPESNHPRLLLMVLVLAVSTLASTLFQLARGIAVLRLEARMDNTVQAGIWDRLLQLPVSFFRRYTSGDLALRALGVTSIRQLLTGVTLSSLLSLVFSLPYFGLLFYYDVQLALLACGMFVIFLLVSAVAALVELRYQRAIHEYRGQIAGLVLQLLTGVARLRVAAAEDRALAVWAHYFGRQKRLAYRAHSAANVLAAFDAAVPVVTTLILFGVISLRPQALSLGEFLAFSVAFTQVLSAALLLSSSVSDLIQIIPLYTRLRPIIESTPEVTPGQLPPGDLRGEIEVSHVSFRYQPDGPLILDDVSLHARPGEFVALVGPSGAGKSTALRLLLGFEKPMTGSIYYDREDLAGLDVQEVRRQIGVVLQDGKVMTGDLLTNINGSTMRTVEDAWEAARLSGLDQDIDAMPMGLYTVLGEGGTTLSGGQRQRLMIARAVVSKPRILLFDEATSALDNQTQARVRRSLESLKATRIVIAHRLSTVRNADRIYVMAAGRIVQSGTYEELLHQDGLFADLVRRQLL
jgi:NHLM bacteriocin system ABC transporter ATP-binding protein